MLFLENFAGHKHWLITLLAFFLPVGTTAQLSKEQNEVLVAFVRHQQLPDWPEMSDAQARASALKFRTEFDALDKILAKQPYLMSDGLSVLDIAWLIYGHRLSLAGYPFERLHSNVQAWVERLRAMPEFAKEIAMPATFFRRIGLELVAATIALAFGPIVANGQDAHDHTPALSGVPQGVPYFCARPSVTSTASGLWSDPRTWSTGKVPGATDKVEVAAGHEVIYNVVSDAKLECVEVDGRLRFDTTSSTRLKVGNLTVMEPGYLEIGTETKPVPPDVAAEIIIADQPLDKEIDHLDATDAVERVETVRVGERADHDVLDQRRRGIPDLHRSRAGRDRCVD